MLVVSDTLACYCSDMILETDECIVKEMDIKLPLRLLFFSLSLPYCIQVCMAEAGTLREISVRFLLNFCMEICMHEYVYTAFLL